jgi:hypothetical protein
MSDIVFDDMLEDELCSYCGDGDRVPKGHWTCPVCDAEWHEEKESERPTPETDAENAQFPMGGYTLDFCRKLERERDEARDALLGRTVSCSQCNQVAVERDEARELARELRDALVAHYEEYSGWSIRGDVHNRVVAALNKAQFTLPEK